MTGYQRMIDEAHTYLSPCVTYGHALLDGEQRWDGSDLKDSAKGWTSYSWTRIAARSALENAGGCIVVDVGKEEVYETCAKPVPCMTDFILDREPRVYETAHGYMVRVTPETYQVRPVRPATAWPRRCTCRWTPPRRSAASSTP